MTDRTPPARWNSRLSSPVVLYGAIALVVLAAVGIGAYVAYRMTQPNYAEVYKALGIDPLPGAVETAKAVQDRLEQLRLNPCDKDAILPLANALEAAGQARAGVTGIVNFSARCGGHPDGLESAYRMLYRLRDWRSSERVADELIKLEPD